MNLSTIKKYSRSYSGGLRGLAMAIGMTEANLHRCIQKNRINAADLEKIATELKVNIGEFYSDEAKSGTSAVSAEALRIADLESALADKEKIIQLYERFCNVSEAPSHEGAED